MRKLSAVTVFLNGSIQERRENQIIVNGQTAHFEVGGSVRMGEGEKKILKIRRHFFGSVSVYFEGGLVWTYNKNFQYIVS